MMQNRPAPRPSRGKINFTRIPLSWLGLVVGALLVNWAFHQFFGDDRPEHDEAAVRTQAIAEAQRAVREKVGDSLSITFSGTPQVEVTDVYTVRSQFISTNRRGERHGHPWVVTLKRQEGSGTQALSWQVLSCDVGG